LVHVPLAQGSAGALGGDGDGGAGSGFGQQAADMSTCKYLFLVSKALEGSRQVDWRLDRRVSLRNIRLHSHNVRDSNLSHAMSCHLQLQRRVRQRLQSGRKIQIPAPTRHTPRKQPQRHTPSKQPQPSCSLHVLAQRVFSRRVTFHNSAHRSCRLQSCRRDLGAFCR
jgi:hypothetical protein